MINNYNILKEVGTILGRELIVIAVRSYNIKSRKLEGRQIHLFSDEETGISLYSNGVVISGQYNPIKGQGSIKFVHNPKFETPWVSTNNYIDAQTIAIDLDLLIDKNPCIYEKHEAVKIIVNNYSIFLHYCLSKKYVQIRNLNHPCTQRYYLDLINNREVAAAKNTIQDEVTVESSCLKDREPGLNYITFEPGFVYIEDCNGKHLKRLDLSTKILGSQKLKDLPVSYTEKYFVKCGITKMSKELTIICSDKSNFPNDGRVYVQQ